MFRGCMKMILIHYNSLFAQCENEWDEREIDTIERR